MNRVRLGLSVPKLLLGFVAIWTGILVFVAIWTGIHIVVDQRNLETKQGLTSSTYSDSDSNQQWSQPHGYEQGRFGESDKAFERLVLKSCISHAGIVSTKNHCSIVTTRFSCCFCYPEYPEFVWDSSIVNTSEYKLGRNESRNNKIMRYWFCAKPGIGYSNLTAKWKNELANTTVAIVTGKWGNDDQFNDEVVNYCQGIHETGIFQPADIYCYSYSPEFVLHDKRFQRHLMYRTDPDDESERGGGYWFHKTVLVRHHMNSYREGDLIIWTDVDRIDYLQKETICTLLRVMEQRKSDFLIEEFGLEEFVWTKEDMLLAFNASELIRSSGQVNANAWIVRNNLFMRNLLDAIIECSTDWHMISDEVSYFANDPNFEENRHDQSILGLMIKTFLSKQEAAAIGPPARSYLPPDHEPRFSTFQNEVENNQLVSCPFGAFYQRFALQINKTKKKKKKKKKET